MAVKKGILKVGDTVEADNNCTNDFKGGKGVVTHVYDSGEIKIKVTRSSSFYSFGILTPSFRWYDFVNLIENAKRFEEINHYMVYGTGCENKSELFKTEKEANAYAKECLQDGSWTGEIYVCIVDAVSKVEKKSSVKTTRYY